MTEDLRVLVLEDDPMQLELLDRFLGGSGFEIVASAGPNHLSREMDERDPDVVLVDVNAGVSKEEFPAFVATLLDRRARIILFSAADPASLRAIAQRTRAHGYLSKSESLIDLGEKLRAFAAARPGG